jgi:hypothetical protein
MCDSYTQAEEDNVQQHNTHSKLQLQNVLDSTLCLGIYYVILKLNIIFFTTIVIIWKNSHV